MIPVPHPASPPPSAPGERAAELALVSEVAGALVGPLLPPEIATAFLRGVASVLHPEATAMFLLYDEAQKVFRSIAAEGALSH